MVSSSSKRKIETQSPNVLDWIEARPGEMHCRRCDSSAKLVRLGEFDDGIPRIVLPHAWFDLHSNPEHVPGEAREDRSDPAPATPEKPPEKPVATPPVPPPPPPLALDPDDLSPHQAFLFATEPVRIKRPKVIPIAPEDARILCGRDALELLCGADRAEVLRHRRAVLAGTETEKDEPLLWKPSAPWQPVQPVEEAFPEREPVDPSWRTLPHNTYVNVSGAVAWIRFPKRAAPAPVASHASVWLYQETFDMQPDGVRDLFARATTVPAMLDAGAIEMTDRLRLSLERCGMLAPGAR